MIIFDLEWNRGYDKKDLDEILQIGAVRIPGLGQPIQDTFNIYIHPKVHKKFGPGAKRLPDLQASMDSQVDFPRAMARFRAWCGAEQMFGTWGRDDFKALRQNCAYWGLPLPDFQQEYDLQRAFGHAIGADGKQIALQQAVEICGIAEQEVFHNALHDALYTAAVTTRITEEALTYQPPKKERKQRRRIPRFSEETFPSQPRYRIGPFPTAEALLSAPAARRPKCPVCGRALWVHQWHGPLGQQYMAVFRCPEHGRFLCRVTLTRTKDGQWRGRTAIPAITPGQPQAYAQALAVGSVRCSGGPCQKKKKRQKKATSKKKENLQLSSKT